MVARSGVVALNFAELSACVYVSVSVSVSACVSVSVYVSVSVPSCRSARSERRRE